MISTYIATRAQRYLGVSKPHPNSSDLFLLSSTDVYWFDIRKGLVPILLRKHYLDSTDDSFRISSFEQANGLFTIGTSSL